QDKRFDLLLDLLGSANNTIASRVRIFHIDLIFTETYKYGPRTGMHLAAERFTQLESLQLSRLIFDWIPEHVRDFLQALPAAELQIDWASMRHVTFAALLNSRLVANASRNLAFYGFRTSVQHPELRVSQQRFHFTTIDATSLVSFLNVVWNTASAPTVPRITVHTFHLRLTNPGPNAVSSEDSLNILNNRALPHFGSNIEALCLPLDSALKSFNAGIIELDRQQEEMASVWTVIGRLPPSHMERFGFILHLNDIDKLPLGELLRFPFASTVERLHPMFPSLKQVKFTMLHYNRSEPGLPGGS
ncbi:hypothetical protein H0H87_010081, partial [Tephrocybe sp. NHM501043]